MTHHDPSEHELDRALSDARLSYHLPPEPPLDAMWKRIEQERFTDRPTRWRGRAPWWLAIAAALVGGVALGRLTVAPTATTEAAAQALSTDSVATTYDRPTARYLGQTAALLVSLPGEARAGLADRRYAARAAELLVTTRLLLDSPTAGDPKVRALLEDVELVLAQIAHLETNRDPLELELIAQALEQRDLLPRLTSAAAGGTEAD